MIKYKKVVTKNNRVQYWKNGKMVAADQIPQSILANLEDGVELSVGSPEPEQTVDQNDQNEPQLDQDKSCIFCGEQSDRSKLINMQLIYLCKSDYNSHTTGEIAAHMREENGKDQKN